MPELLQQKFLGTPLIVWILQLIFVAAVLVIFTLFLERINANTKTRLLVQIAYVTVIIIINVIWRLAIRKLFPNWFYTTTLNQDI